MNLQELNKRLKEESQGTLYKQVFKDSEIKGRYNVCFDGEILGYIRDDSYMPANTMRPLYKKEVNLILEFMNTRPKYNIILFQNVAYYDDLLIMVHKVRGYEAIRCYPSSMKDSAFQFSEYEIEDLINKNPKYEKIIRLSLVRVSD